MERGPQWKKDHTRIEFVKRGWLLWGPVRVMEKDVFQNC